MAVNAQGAALENGAKGFPIVQQARAGAELRALPDARPKPRVRIEAIDLARGLAIALMILSHGIKGLLAYEQIPDWGLVPIHLVTKFSSTLFILVFGASLGAAYLPRVDTPEWPKLRTRLLVRGLKVLFWYKALTVIEMAQLYTRQEVVDAILYRAFPVFSEILGFYAIALLWIPFALPLWKRSPVAVRAALPFVAGACAILLSRHFGFFGSEILRALFVEHERHYTWGQLTRAPIVLAGLLLGAAVLAAYPIPGKRRLLALGLGGAGLAALGIFAILEREDLRSALFALARNEGKHPPDAQFLAFSGGGALVLFAAALAGGDRAARLLAPITAIGRNALQAFVCHVVILFVVYRYLCDFWRKVPYEQALWLTLLMAAATAAWVKGLAWVKRHS
jgi:predicted acyltransferase